LRNDSSYRIASTRDKRGQCDRTVHTWKAFAASRPCKWCCCTSSPASCRIQHSTPGRGCALFDGHTAVYVFFLISGAVLTPSFARAGAFIGKLAKRIVRLYAGCRRCRDRHDCWHSYRTRTARRNANRVCMARNGLQRRTHADASRARDGPDSLLLGYREATLFAPLADHLPLMESRSTRRSGRCIWNYGSF
jgi:hypothetical protein